MRDYASRYSTGAASRQRFSGQRPAGAGGQRTLKIIGVMAVFAMLLGVGSSVWFGMALQAGLSNLDKSRQEQTVLRAENEKLASQRAAFMEQDTIETAARNLGLFSPAENQIRKP